MQGLDATAAPDEIRTVGGVQPARPHLASIVRILRPLGQQRQAKLTKRRFLICARPLLIPLNPKLLLDAFVVFLIFQGALQRGHDESAPAHTTLFALMLNSQLHTVRKAECDSVGFAHTLIIPLKG